ncbi:ABC transporter ATP-binding protein [Rhizobium sullae]|uniref:ABC-type multidrug transport system fused ATPase/permease subunit n=1 Tax=Rhizobium sullae TaxID=50338 RepID=A0A4R3Q9T4_RHISU|nr:ABC transporter ATP-binding protein [Rhizobium sullae]TCU18200.1 ABC-type multidrug transport system fused ATPase/permease subunit [Rhizobium sullae]
MCKLDTNDVNALRTIFQGASKRHVAFVLGLIALNTVATIGTPVIFGRLIDGLTAGSLAFPALLFCLYALVVGSARFITDLSFRLVEFIELDVIHHAGVKLFDAVLRKKASLSHHYQAGFMVDAVRNMQDSYGIYVFLVFSTLFPSVLETIVAAFVVAAVINWQIGLLVLAYAIAIVALTYISNEKAKIKQEEAIATLAESAEVLGEAMGSFQVIKAAQGGGWFAQIYRSLREEARRNWQQYHRIRLTFALARSLAFALQLALMYFVSVRLYESGTISVGQIVIFNGLILQLNRPSELIAGALEDLLSARQLQDGYKKIMDYPEFSAIPIAKQHSMVDREAGQQNAVEFRNVTFSYDGGTPILDNFSTRFQKGRLNFITGPSGVGKTTLLRLLLRFVEDYDGDITILGRDLVSYSEPELFSTIGYVPQSPDILAASLADNVRLGSNITDEAIDGALQKVGLIRMVERLPQSIHTHVGRGGVALSGGEMQRVAIARAIIQRPRVLLLDEPSSALDAHTERNIFKHLRVLRYDMTIIAITHRTSMIEEDDFVLDFAKGSKSRSVVAERSHRKDAAKQKSIQSEEHRHAEASREPEHRQV